MPLMWIVLVLALITGTWLSVQSNHATSSAEPGRGRHPGQELAALPLQAGGVRTRQPRFQRFAGGLRSWSTGLVPQASAASGLHRRRHQLRLHRLAAGRAGGSRGCRYGIRPSWRQAQRPVSHTPPRSHCHCAPCSHPRGRGGRGQITSRGQ